MVPDQIQSRKDPGEKMGGSYQADVIGPLILQPQKGIGQLPGGKCFSVQLAADPVVLAEAAAQRTAAEKYRAASPGTADAGLLPEMQGSPGSNGTGRCLAKALLYRAVNPAHAWTELAVMNLFLKIS